jgi:hypothetical protein
MSETGRTGTGPVSSTPVTRATADRSAQRREEPTAWVGWIFFGGTMMVMLGAFHAVAGLVALFDDTYYLVGSNGLVVSVDYTAWGWAHLVLGGLAIAAGLGVMVGQTWARVAAICLAGLSALVNLAFMSAYPLWSVLIIALDVVVIYALAVHGREVRA